MRGHARRSKRRASLRGWIKWLPFLVLPFSVLLCEAWLNIETFENDYEAASLNSAMHSLRQDIEELREQELNLRAMDRIQEKAPDLGLVNAEPNQIRLIRYAERDGELIVYADADTPSGGTVFASLDVGDRETAEAAAEQPELRHEPSRPTEPEAKQGTQP